MPSISSILVSSNKKNRIDLTAYNYRRDIQNRLLMSHFTTLEVEAINEILNSSLNLSIKSLSRVLDAEESQVHIALEKLSRTGLFARHGDTLIVDKEMRKYYEVHINRFEEDFQPDIEFILALLKKIPIHILPTWYSISKTSDNIFQSIIEKYLISPHAYQRYLLELNFDHEAMSGIMQDVFNHPSRRVPSKTLKTKYNLSNEAFIEIMIHLEFQFICYSSFIRYGNEWQEVITPFREWHEYLQFIEQNSCTAIADTTDIQVTYPDPLYFIKLTTAFLTVCQSHGDLTLDENQLPTADILDEILQVIEKSFPFTLQIPLNSPLLSNLLPQVIQKICLVKLGELNTKNQLHLLSSAQQWLELSIEDQAIYLYRHPLNRLSPRQCSPELCTDRNIREIERCLKRVVHLSWISFESFFKGITAEIGESEGISLVREGGRWKYRIPHYSQEEKNLIQAIIFNRLAEIGFVGTGKYQGKDCFYVTPLGEMILGE